MLRTRLVALATLLAASPFLHSQLSVATNSPNGAPLSQRVVDYNIDARLDTDHKTLDATETLTYHNLTGQPLTTFPFHLYLNAFRPQSTFTTGTRRYGGVRGEFTEDYYPPEKLGEITISHIDADSYGDLTSALHFIAPDDGNMDDHTVAEIALPRPLPAGDSITFHIAFHDKFPLSVARNGYKRDFVMGAQWFPKLGVFWHGAWNCHQYHATTEFFSDFGAYTVRLTLPRNYTVGASGVPTSSVVNQDGTRTLGYYGEDIHDFAFAASPNFVATDGTYLSSLGPVQVHVLALRAHPGIGPRYLDITLKAMQHFEQSYGPYPYKIITVIDPEPGSQMEGMEYATLFTADGSWWGPLKAMELTVVHEFGHQYWQGMVATNEFEEAWLDEGINSYSEVKTLASILGPNTSALDRSWSNLGDAGYQRISYLTSPDYDPVSRFGWKFRDFESYGGVTYGKSATLLATLESIIGRDTMEEAMRTYFERYRFTHPTAEDFLRTIEEVAVAHGKAGRLTSAPAAPAETAPAAPNPYSFVLTGTNNNPTSATLNGATNNPGSVTLNGAITNPGSVTLNGTTNPRNVILNGTTANPGSVILSGASRNATGGVEGPAFSPLTPSTNSANFANAPVVNSSLRPYINQAVYGTELLDYAIDRISSSPVRWWEPVKKDSQFIDIVYLHRKGNFILPLTVQINFTDGTYAREQWDGADRWTRFSYTRNARIASAEIDPDHVTFLDKDFFNNSYSTHSNPVPARKLTNLWLALQQLAAQIFAWIV